MTIGGYDFRQVRGLQGKPLPAFAIFQVPSAPNSQYTKVAYLGVAHSVMLQVLVLWPVSSVLMNQQHGTSRKRKR